MDISTSMTVPQALRELNLLRAAEGEQHLRSWKGSIHDLETALTDARGRRGPALTFGDPVVILRHHREQTLAAIKSARKRNNIVWQTWPPCSPEEMTQVRFGSRSHEVLALMVDGTNTMQMIAAILGQPRAVHYTYVIRREYGIGCRWRDPKTGEYAARGTPDMIVEAWFPEGKTYADAVKETGVR